MPRDGSGVHSLDPGYLAVPGETIEPSQHNPPLEDLSNAITESIARTGVTTVTADIPFNSKRLTSVGNATAAMDALNRQTADGRYASGGFGLTAAVASNALTVTLTDAAGGAISATNPVTIRLLGASGSATAITLTSPLSLVISSGSTLGTINAGPFNLYLAVFDDGGTARLGLTQQASGTTVVPLYGQGVASSTAEGGAGAADSSATWYTGAAVASKAFGVIARLEWNSGLTTAGTWALAPDKIVLSHPGFLLPGMVVDTSPRGLVTALSTVSTVTPIDNTIPQITEGAELTTAGITLKTAASRIRGRAFLSAGHNTANAVVTLHVHHNSTANAIAATTTSQLSNPGGFVVGAMTFLHTPGLAGTSTYRLRGGPNTGAFYPGGYSINPFFNGVYQSVTLDLEEIMA